MCRETPAEWLCRARSPRRLPSPRTRPPARRRSGCAASRPRLRAQPMTAARQPLAAPDGWSGWIDIFASVPRGPLTGARAVGHRPALAAAPAGPWGAHRTMYIIVGSSRRACAASGEHPGVDQLQAPAGDGTQRQARRRLWSQAERLLAVQRGDRASAWSRSATAAGPPPSPRSLPCVHRRDAARRTGAAPRSRTARDPQSSAADAAPATTASSSLA